MKFRIKRALAMLTALAIVCSFAVIPASAAGSVSLQMKNGSWNSEVPAEQTEYTVDVYAHSTDGNGIANYIVNVDYDSEYLTLDDLLPPENGFSGSFDGNKEDGAIGSMSGRGIDFADGEICLGTLVFKKVSGVESATVTVTASCNEMGDKDGTAYEGIANGTISVDVPGDPPMLDRVELSENSVEVNGAEVKIDAAAKSTKGSDISAVTWEISPSTEDVTYSDGKIIVAGNAKPGSYTITASPVSGQSRGDPKTAALTVTRAPAAAATVTVEGDATAIIPAEGAEAKSYTYAATVLNQFGDEMTGETVTWSTSALPAGVTFANGVLTVASTAAEADNAVTITAAASNDKTGSIRVSLKKIQVVAPTVTVNSDEAYYGNSWSRIVALSGGSANINGTNVPGTFSVKGGDGSANAVGTGNMEYTVVFNSSDGVYKDIACVNGTAPIGKRAITVDLSSVDAEVKKYTGDTFEVTEEVAVNADMITEGSLYGQDTVSVRISAEGKEVGTYYYEVESLNEHYAVTRKENTGRMVIMPADQGKTEVVDKFEDETLQEDNNIFEKTLEDFLKYLGLSAEIEVSIEAGGEKKTYTTKVVWSVYNKTSKEWVTGDAAWSYIKSAVNNLSSSGDELTFRPVFEENPALAPVEANLPEKVVTLSRVSYGGGGSGGSGSVWSPNNRGNQNIVITPVSLFGDVSNEYWAMADINWVSLRGIMSGYSDGTFRPGNTTNRQQMWMVLGRLSGSNPADMAAARTWAMNSGVSDGTNPTSSMSRQQLVTMLYRWAQSKGYVKGGVADSISGYADAGSVSSYARDAMNWAIANGIISGNGSSLNPQGTASRAHFAAIMHRFCSTFGLNNSI